MNLKELSQEQQRTVIQMQLQVRLDCVLIASRLCPDCVLMARERFVQGNRFFEHLVNIAECRKNLDLRYNLTDDL